MLDQPAPRYLGDSVYARFDGYMLWIYTDNGNGPKNEIALEPFVLTALNQFRDSLVEKTNA